jgi:hypothetical protein
MASLFDDSFPKGFVHVKVGGQNLGGGDGAEL